MINIYTKTQAEIDEQQSLYNFAAAVVKGMPFEVCPTYLMKKDGTKVDTKDLTEDDIMSIMAHDVKDFYDPNGSYKKNGRTELDFFKLAKIVRENWTPSYDAILKMYQMEEVYGHIMADIMGGVDRRDISGQARIIAQFQKETAGDFGRLDRSDIIAVLEQLSYNEKAKSQQNGMHR